jgi:hypothetical protein
MWFHPRRAFLHYRYPALEPKPLKRRAKALFYRLNKGSTQDRVDYPTFRSYILEEDPTLAVYAAQIQRAMRRRTFGEGYWEELTRKRNKGVSMDVVLERRVGDILNAEAALIKQGKRPDFAQDFHAIAKKIKDDKKVKVSERTRKQASGERAEVANPSHAKLSHPRRLAQRSRKRPSPGQRRPRRETALSSGWKTCGAMGRASSCASASTGGGGTWAWS